MTLCFFPERVYEEIAGTTGETKEPPIETAIEEEWAQVADPLDYTISVVSQAMDGVQRYIASADDRPADEVERADAALAAPAAQHLAQGWLHMYTFTRPTSLQGKVPKPYLHRTGMAMQ